MSRKVLIDPGSVGTIVKKPQRRFGARYALVAGLIFLIAGGVWWYTKRPEFTPADPTKMVYVLDNPSIAVLAFDNLTGDPDREFVSDGLSFTIPPNLSACEYTICSKLMGSSERYSGPTKLLQ